MNSNIVRTHRLPAELDGKLLTHPRNSSTRRIFVAATRQNDGKTTTCLGLLAALQNHYKSVSYIKPIGQRFIDVDGIKIDEDSFLLNSIYHYDIPLEATSPVAIDSGFTRRFLDQKGGLEHLVDKICRAFDLTAYQQEAIVIEGSGHAGVGSICNLSNAEVARLLGAKAIIISQGGIGAPVDEICLNKALFDKFGVEVVGAILNKAIPEKLDIVQDYAGRALERQGIPLLGVVPHIATLASPNLSQIVKQLKGRWLNAEATGKYERIDHVVVGAMAARGLFEYIEPRTLIITPGDRDEVILAVLASANMSQKSSLGGLLLTRGTDPHPRLMEQLCKTRIPVIICEEDSYTVASGVNSMTVKTQPQDEDKIPVIKDLIQKHVDLERLVGAFSPQ